MSKLALVGISAVVFVTVGAGPARALDISAKQIAIKDHPDVTKRQIKVQSADAAVLLTDADDPATNGAALHIYSATDDFCALLPAGPEWQNKGTKWKYKNKTTKNGAQVKDGRLSVKIRQGVTYSLADDGTQGDVNVQVQFGTGVRYCMRCSGNKKNDAKKFVGKSCVAAPCDLEPSTCNPSATTTSSTTVTTTSSTTTSTVLGTVVGALTATPGRFNYNLNLGLTGAHSACNSNFPGSHACQLVELQNTSAAALTGLQDTGANTVTSFWAIDPSADPVTAQCFDDANFDPNTQPGHNWEYGTAHTISRGQKIPLNNGTGVLGSLQTGLQCNLSGSAWVGCCQ